MLMVGDERDEGFGEGDGFVGGFEHLPIGGDESFAHELWCLPDLVVISLSSV
jgi:hypothetical protein